MSKPFILEDFLLESGSARMLYHEYAADMPIIDYHCHLPPDEVAQDKRFSSITECWLGGDHYKWRALRSNGVPEELVTGSSGDWEKFEAWAATMPKLLGNPLYHWTHLELVRYFGVSELLSERTAKEIYEKCNERLKDDDFSARGLIQRSNVLAIGTTDDPCDSLEHHRAVNADSSIECKLFPTWRPDKGMMPEKVEQFNGWVDRLGETAGIEVKDLATYREALQNRHDFFAENGCAVSDHGIETFYADEYTESEIAAIFDKVRAGSAPDELETGKFKSAMLYEFGLMNAEKGWVQQFHYGPLRNNSTRLFEKLGPDIGCDSIGDMLVAEPMSRFFDRLDREGKLAKTIIYNINARDNELVASMIGNFQDGSVAGKMQMGSGWWFCDQMDGMIRQMESLAQLGLLSRFVGMLTDSRSFLSFTRHEYFRRILCNKLGSEMDRGWLPNDIDLVGNMVRDICFNNAANYFDFGIDPETS
ncbi:MAG: glucuronate isomerase [Verrucomicrobiota bacterium]